MRAQPFGQNEKLLKHFIFSKFLWAVCLFILFIGVHILTLNKVTDF